LQNELKNINKKFPFLPTDTARSVWSLARPRSARRLRGMGVSNAGSKSIDWAAVAACSSAHGQGRS
jgi:hypothetical protein